MFPIRDAEHTAQRIKCPHCTYRCKKKNQRKMQTHIRSSHPEHADEAGEYGRPAKMHTVAGVRFAETHMRT